MAEADELAKLAPDVLVSQRGQGQSLEFVLRRTVVIKYYEYTSQPQELGDIVSQMMRLPPPLPNGGQGSGNAVGPARLR